MNRITLNVILRTVFGADGAELDYLREIIPPWAKLGSRMATLPEPPFSTGRYSPWGRLAEFRRNFDRTVFALIDKAEADPHLDERTDILALLLRSRYEDGTPMSRQDVSDELLTLLGAGHETTASTLGWAFERLRRHPAVLAELVKENDEGGNEFRQATIQELQRQPDRHRLLRTPCSGAALRSRRLADSARLHRDDRDRQRARQRAACSRIPSVSIRTDSSAPGPRRRGCRSVAEPVAASEPRSPTSRWMWCCERYLRHFVIETDDAPDEKIHFRGIAFTPKDGGRIVVRRRGSARLDSPVPSLRGGLCLAQRPLRQLPVRPREVAGVAVRIALEVVLVLGLGFPEVACRRHLGDHLAGPQP